MDSIMSAIGSAVVIV